MNYYHTECHLELTLDGLIQVTKQYSTYAKS